MHIRDKRSVSEQVRSGFRIAGFILLTLALMSVLLDSTAFLLGKNSNPGPGHRFIGAAGLLAVSILMLFTSRYWAKWFAAVLAWAILRWAFRAPFNASLSGWLILEVLAILAVLFVLSVGPAMRRTPKRIETVGLVVAVLSLSFATVASSYFPAIVGIAVLGLARFIAWKKPERRSHHSSAKTLGQVAR